jgi:hypothetical protein
VNFTAGEATYDGRYLQSVATGAGLTGNGTTASPLAVDFASGETTYDGRYLLQNGIGTLSGGLNVLGFVTVLPAFTGGDALFCQGGLPTGANPAGRGLVAVGGSSLGTGTGGTAIDATGGAGGAPGLAAQFHGYVVMNGDLNPANPVGLTGGVLLVGDTTGSTVDAIVAQGGTPNSQTVSSGVAGTGGSGGRGATVIGGNGGDRLGSTATTGGVGGDGLSVVGGNGGSGGMGGQGGIGGEFQGGAGDPGLASGAGAGGDGVHTLGGFGFNKAGNGLVATGGFCDFGRGGIGIVAEAGLGGAGILGLAGQFKGDVEIQGNLTVSGNINGAAKPWKIDHPLDPDNKFLFHVAVESPDMKNMYDGVVVLDEKGEAVVELPSYFEALNRDFRYQLTCLGGFAPVYVGEKIHENRFKIAGGREGLEVSWLVTGIRQDAYANAHRIQVEVEKDPTEKGKLLHPVERGRPESDGIDSTKNPRRALASSNSASSKPTASTPATREVVASSAAPGLKHD